MYSNDLVTLLISDRTVKNYMQRLGDKASNPVFQDFITEMEKPKPDASSLASAGSGGWFSSVSNFVWASSGALR